MIALAILFLLPFIDPFIFTSMCTKFLKAKLTILFRGTVESMLRSEDALCKIVISNKKKLINSIKRKWKNGKGNIEKLRHKLISPNLCEFSYLNCAVICI